jgi:hypothetical protein
MKTMTALTALLCLIPAFTALANDGDREPAYEPLFKDNYQGSGEYCDSDCRRQDRVRNDRNASPHQLENELGNGRNGNGKSISDIMNNQLEPAGGR